MDGLNETSTSNPSNDNSNDFNGLNALLLAAQRNGNSNSSHHSSSSSSSRSSTPSNQNHPRPHSNPQAHSHPQSHSHSHSRSMPPPPPRKASRSQVNRSKIQLPTSSSSTSTQSCCPSETTMVCSSSNQDQSSCSIPNCTISESCPLIHSCSKACQESTCTGATTSTNAINHQPKDKVKDTPCCNLENGGLDLDFSTTCWDFGCDFPISNPPCASTSNQSSTSIDKSQSSNGISKSRQQVNPVNQNMDSVFCETCDGQQSSNNRERVFDSFQELLDCCCCSTDSNLENCCPPDSTIPSTEDCCSSSKLNVSTMETCCSNEGEAQSTTSSSKEKGNGSIAIDERNRIEEGWYESFCEENHHRHDESCNLNHQRQQQQIGSRSVTIPNRKKVERFQNQFSARTKTSGGDGNDSGSSSSSNASDTTPTLIPSSSSSTSESSTNPRSRSASISNGPGISNLNSNHLQNNYQSFIVPSNSNMTSSNFINNNSNRFGSNNDSKQDSMMDTLNDYCQLRIPHQHDEFGGCLDPTLTLCDPLKCNVEAPHSHLQSQTLSSKVIREINKKQEEEQFKCGWVDCDHVARSVAELSDHVQTRHILGMKNGKTRMNGGPIGNGNGNEASDRDAMNGLESRDLNRWYHQQQQQQQQPSHSHGQFHHQQHQPQLQNHHHYHQNNYSHPHSQAHSHPVHHQHHHQQHQGFQSQNQQNQNQNQNQNPSVDSNSTSSSSLSLSESQLQLQEQVALAFEQCLWDQCQIPMSNYDSSTNFSSSSHQIPSNGHQFQPSNGGPHYPHSHPSHGNFMNEGETNSSVNTPSTTTPNTTSTDSSINNLTSSSSSSTPNHHGNEKTTTSSSSFFLQHLISDHLGILPSDSEQILNSLGLNGENLNKFLGGLNNHNQSHTKDGNDEDGSYLPSLGGQGVESSQTISTGSKRKRNIHSNNRSSLTNGAQASSSSFLNKRTKSMEQNSNGKRSSRNLKCNSQTHSHGKRIEREEEGIINEGESTDSTLSPLSKISQDSPYDLSSSNHHHHHHQNQGSSSSSIPIKSIATSSSKQINADPQQQQQEVVNPDHICDWLDCGLKFNSYEELTKHVNELHVGSGKSTYECKWKDCQRANEGRLFTQRQKVLRHMQTHTGDRPYKCDICSKRFSEPNTLTQHIRTHTNEKPYICDFPNCGKSFAIAGSLTIHKRTHTGDKPFMCSHPGCGKAFSESSNLTKHMRTHSGERPFKCPECDRCFSRPDQMNRHRKAHDNPNSKLNNKVEIATT